MARCSGPGARRSLKTLHALRPTGVRRPRRPPPNPTPTPTPEPDSCAERKNGSAAEPVLPLLPWDLGDGCGVVAALRHEHGGHTRRGIACLVGAHHGQAVYPTATVRRTFRAKLHGQG